MLLNGINADERRHRRAFVPFPLPLCHGPCHARHTPYRSHASRKKDEEGNPYPVVAQKIFPNLLQHLNLKIALSQILQVVVPLQSRPNFSSAAAAQTVAQGQDEQGCLSRHYDAAERADHVAPRGQGRRPGGAQESGLFQKKNNRGAETDLNSVRGL